MSNLMRRCIAEKRPPAFSQVTVLQGKIRFRVALLLAAPVNLITRIISKNVCWALTFSI